MDWIESSAPEEDDPQGEQREKLEAERLRSLARITPVQAAQSAQATQPGVVKEVELENDAGNLVYEVLIAKTEIIVDAGNGKVLYTEPVNAADTNNQEDVYPRSSIQIPANKTD